MNLFDTALSVDLALVIETYSGIKIDSSRNRNTVCPICDHGHNTGCFGLYGKQKGRLDRFKCFSCGAHGDAIDFVMTFKHLSSRADAAKDICDSFGLSYEEKPKAYADGFLEYSSALLSVAQLFVYFLNVSKDRSYFLDRGISKEVQEEYLLGYCPEFFTSKDGKVVSFRSILKAKGFDDALIDSLGLVNKSGDCIFAGRFIFPIMDGSGNVIAFSGRSLNPNVPKYINSPETTFFRKSSVLYNLHKAKAFSDVYVVEGYMDALSMITVGRSNVVAAMGTAFGAYHLKALSGKRITLALDNDEAGRKHVASIIESFKDTKFYVLKKFPYKDLNEALCDSYPLFECICDVEPGPVFYCHYLAHHLDLSTLEGRAKLYKKFASLIGGHSPEWRKKYPVNTSYGEFDLDYFWKRCIRYVRKRKEVR